MKLKLSTEVYFPTVSLNKSELEFCCVPPCSYSYNNVIIQNITFIPATYSWEILEEFFEIEKLPVANVVSNIFCIISILFKKL